MSIYFFWNILNNWTSRQIKWIGTGRSIEKLKSQRSEKVPFSENIDQTILFLGKKENEAIRREKSPTFEETEKEKVEK